MPQRATPYPSTAHFPSLSVNYYTHHGLLKFPNTVDLFSMQEDQLPSQEAVPLGRNKLVGVGFSKEAVAVNLQLYW